MFKIVHLPALSVTSPGTLQSNPIWCISETASAELDNDQNNDMGQDDYKRDKIFEDRFRKWPRQPIVHTKANTIQMCFDSEIVDGETSEVGFS